MHLCTRLRSFFLVVLAAGFPAIASAHPGHEGGHDVTWDFTTGVNHPFGGWDHLLAALAVGLWAAQFRGRARWALGATFLIVMSLAATLGRWSVPVPVIEQGVAVSVLLLGIFVASAARFRAPVRIALVAVFAAFHGYAHAASSPSPTAGIVYTSGLFCGTALLLGAGLATGLSVNHRAPRRTREVAGWLITAAGVAVLGLVNGH